MGKFATTVQSYLCDRFAEACPEQNWETEHHIAGTPVDIAGFSDDFILLIELEWRRADPADNSAKLFRHLDQNEVMQSNVVVIQVFTAYYDLVRGGVSSKRKNAEFVGQAAENTVDQLSYYPVNFDLKPPMRDEDWPDEWKQAANDVVERIKCMDVYEDMNSGLD